MKGLIFRRVGLGRDIRRVDFGVVNEFFDIGNRCAKVQFFIVYGYRLGRVDVGLLVLK